MKVLSVGSDRNLFKEGSAVRSRVLDYGNLVEELYVIVFSLKKLNLKKQKISNNTFIYPTNSTSRWLYVFDAIGIGKELIRSWKLETRNSRNDIVVTTQDPFESGIVGWAIKKKFNLALHIQIHTDFLSSYFTRGYLLNTVRVSIAKFVLPKADCIRVVSERIKKSLISQFPNFLVSKISVLPVYVDIEKINQTSVSIDLQKKYPGRFIILMASRITKEKNIDLAINAIEEVAKKDPNILLLVVGDGPEQGALIRKSKILNLKSNITFESAVSSETLISYYKTADLYLLTSNYEGYGRTIIEAAAANCPVITTDVGLVGELEGLTTVPVNGEKELIYAIFRQLKEPLGAPKLPQIGDYRAYLDKYRQSWEKCRNET